MGHKEEFLMKKQLLKIGALALTVTMAAPVLFGTAPIMANDTVVVPVASGTSVAENARVRIDYSNVRDGYFMVRWLGDAPADVRVAMNGPSGIEYQYRIGDGNWHVIPLTCGNGTYVVRIAAAAGDGRFSVAKSMNLSVALTDELAPFLRPNQFVNFNADSEVVRLASEITAGSNNMFESVTAVYNWVVQNIEYDFELARTVQSGYIPNLDRVLEVRRGICFDYASLMTAMLRSQGIPTRLVIGMVGDVNHAWISVFSEATGWVQEVIQFDGQTWNLMDPTFTSTGNSSEEVRRFIGNGANHRQTHLH